MSLGLTEPRVTLWGVRAMVDYQASAFQKHLLLQVLRWSEEGTGNREEFSSLWPHFIVFSTNLAGAYREASPCSQHPPGPLPHPYLQHCASKGSLPEVMAAQPSDSPGRWQRLLANIGQILSDSKKAPRQAMFPSCFTGLCHYQEKAIFRKD